jgi:hypothetical protein
MGSSTPGGEERRRRSPLPVLLLVAAVLSGLLVGQLVYGGDDSEAEPAAAPQRPAVSAVPSSPEPAPVLVTGSGQSSGLSSPASGTARAGADVGLDVTTSVLGEVAPGRPALVVLVLRNAGPSSVVVRGASAAVTEVSSAGLAGVPACSAGWFAVEGLAGTVRVPASSTRRLELPLTFLDSPSVNQDDCKHAQFRYSYTVRAEQS